MSSDRVAIDSTLEMIDAELAKTDSDDMCFAACEGMTFDGSGLPHYNTAFVPDPVPDRPEDLLTELDRIDHVLAAAFVIHSTQQGWN